MREYQFYTTLAQNINAIEQIFPSKLQDQNFDEANGIKRMTPLYCGNSPWLKRLAT